MIYSDDCLIALRKNRSIISRCWFRDELYSNELFHLRLNKAESAVADQGERFESPHNNIVTVVIRIMTEEQRSFLRPSVT